MGKRWMLRKIPQLFSAMKVIQISNQALLFNLNKLRRLTKEVLQMSKMSRLISVMMKMNNKKVVIAYQDQALLPPKLVS